MLATAELVGRLSNPDALLPVVLTACGDAADGVAPSPITARSSGSLVTTRSPRATAPTTTVASKKSR
jgi:hypothetical protein